MEEEELQRIAKMVKLEKEHIDHYLGEDRLSFRVS